jgi:hypothetical protein
MDRKPLLCELHAHTTWSDGSLTLTELVDLYGFHRFDVLCVTDHVLPTGSPVSDGDGPRALFRCDRPLGLEQALLEARAAGAAVIAAHPHGREPDPNLSRTTRWFWRNRDRAAGLVDRWELINRQQTFGWIAEFGLPAVATGDFHRLEHLETWKTLLPSAKTEQAVVTYLRSTKTTYVVPWHLRDEPRRRIAA